MHGKKKACDNKRCYLYRMVREGPSERAAFELSSDFFLEAETHVLRHNLDSSFIWSVKNE